MDCIVDVSKDTLELFTILDILTTQHPDFNKFYKYHELKYFNNILYFTPENINKLEKFLENIDNLHQKQDLNEFINNFKKIIRECFFELNQHNQNISLEKINMEDIQKRYDLYISKNINIDIRHSILKYLSEYIKEPSLYLKIRDEIMILKKNSLDWDLPSEFKSEYVEEIKKILKRNLHEKTLNELWDNLIIIIKNKDIINAKAHIYRRKKSFMPIPVEIPESIKNIDIKATLTTFFQVFDEEKMKELIMDPIDIHEPKPSQPKHQKIPEQKPNDYESRLNDGWEWVWVCIIILGFLGAIATILFLVLKKNFDPKKQAIKIQ
jgi:hypothetical protein